MFTQPEGEGGAIRVDNDVIIRVTSMQERLRQMDPANYDVFSQAQDKPTPAYAAPEVLTGRYSSPVGLGFEHCLLRQPPPQRPALPCPSQPSPPPRHFRTLHLD